MDIKSTCNENYSAKQKHGRLYIYAWLSTDYALPLIVRHTYGAVVDEIDDKQLAEVPIPLLQDEAIQQRINDLVLQANGIRYHAYLKEQEAIKKMESIL